MHGSATKSKQLTENLSCGNLVGPDDQIDKLPFEYLLIPVPSRTEMDACPQLAKYRNSDANSIPIGNGLPRSLINAPSSVDVITCDARSDAFPLA